MRECSTRVNAAPPLIRRRPPFSFFATARRALAPRPKPSPLQHPSAVRRRLLGFLPLGVLSLVAPARPAVASVPPPVEASGSVEAIDPVFTVRIVEWPDPLAVLVGRYQSLRVRLADLDREHQKLCDEAGGERAGVYRIRAFSDEHIAPVVAELERTVPEVIAAMRDREMYAVVADGHLLVDTECAEWRNDSEWFLTGKLAFFDAIAWECEVAAEGGGR